MIVLLGANSCISDRLEGYYGLDARRRNRLNDCPAWIFLDLACMFGTWREVWEIVRQCLARRDAQTHGDIQAPPLLQLARRLHRDNANVIGLQENLRLHTGAMTRFKRFVLEQGPSAPGLVGDIHGERLEKRVTDHLENMAHYRDTSQVALQQLGNLLNLVSIIPKLELLG